MAALNSYQTNVIFVAMADNAVASTVCAQLNKGQEIIDGTVTVGVAGTTVGELRLAGNTSGYVFLRAAAAAGTVGFVMPSTVGSNGEQLTTNGNAGTATLSWAAAGSLPEFKTVTDESPNAATALETLKNARVRKFKYRDEEGAITTQDFDTEYIGVMGDEVPELMHHKGKIFNPVNAAGMQILGIQELLRRVEALEKVAGQKVDL